MILQHPFSAVTSAVDGDVLYVLASVRERFTISTLVRLIPARSVSGVRNAVERLVEFGTVDVRTVGRTREYSLNDDHLLAPALRAIAGVRSNLLERLGRAVAAWDYPPLYGALFGSAARGEMTTSSDIDIFLVCPDANDEDWGSVIAWLEEAVTDWTGNDARVVEVHLDGLGVPGHRPLLDSVIEEGVTFFGEPGWLSRAVRSAAA